MNTLVFTFPGMLAIYVYLLSGLIFPLREEDHVTLLLPGFQGHELQAGLYQQV
jgi:hypothetical protein